VTNKSSAGRRASRVAIAAVRAAPAVHAAALAAFALLFAAAAWFLTLEADESWTMMSTLQAFGVPLPPTSALANPTITTGGVHLLVHGLLGRATTDVLAHRAVTLAFAALLLWYVDRLVRPVAGGRLDRRLAALVAFAAVPGFVLQAGMALGEVQATLLLIWGSVVWADHGRRSWRWALAAGAILGMACATRINCLAALPGLVAFALFGGGTRPLLWWRVVLATLSAAVAAGTSVAGSALYLAARSAAAAGQQQYLTNSTGVGAARKSVAQVLQYLVVGDGYLPTLLILAVAGGWAVRRLRATDEAGAADATSRAGVLLFVGLTLWAAWVWRAPVPHLRYLWPAMACIWLSGILQTLIAWRRVRDVAADTVAHAGVAALAAASLATGAGIVLNGESLVLVYQASGLAPRLAPDSDARLRAAADQQALARFAGTLPATTRLLTITPANAYPITYLSGRTVYGITEPAAASGERVLLMQPADHYVWRPSPAFAQWRARHTQPIFRRGDVAALRLAPGAPPPPGGTRPIGQNDLY